LIVAVGLKVQERLNWWYAIPMSLGALCLVQEAKAGSRFELGDAGPVEAQSRIDFTIVIPAFVRLETARRGSSESTSVTQSVSSVPVRVVSNAPATAPAKTSGSPVFPVARNDETVLTNDITSVNAIAIP